MRIVSKGQSWSVYVRVLCTRKSQSILWLELTRDHVPGEQYTMQMKLLHMVSQRSAQHTRTHAQKAVYIEEPSAFPHFHAKSAKPCNSYLCNEERKKKGWRPEEKRMRGQEMDRVGRGRRSIDEIRETSQYCRLLLLISIQ